MRNPAGVLHVEMGLALSRACDAASQVTAMNMMSQAFYEEIVFRAGMQVSGGNLSLLPCADPVSGAATALPV
jgi:hypothetical protein